MPGRYPFLLHALWAHESLVSSLSPHSCGNLAGAMLYRKRLAIAICAVGGESGHILPSRKGNLVPRVRPDSPRSGFALVL